MNSITSSFFFLISFTSVFCGGPSVPSCPSSVYSLYQGECRGLSDPLSSCDGTWQLKINGKKLQLVDSSTGSDLLVFSNPTSCSDFVYCLDVWGKFVTRSCGTDFVKINEFAHHLELKDNGDINFVDSQGQITRTVSPDFWIMN